MRVVVVVQDARQLRECRLARVDSLTESGAKKDKAGEKQERRVEIEQCVWWWFVRDAEQLRQCRLAHVVIHEERREGLAHLLGSLIPDNQSSTSRRSVGEMRTMLADLRACSLTICSLSLLFFLYRTHAWTRTQRALRTVRRWESV